MRSVIFLLITFPCSISLNILMYVMVGGKSHLQFATNLIELLNENGHSVDAILGMLNSYVHLKGTYGTRKMVAVHFPGESPWGAIARQLNYPFEQMSEWDRLKPESNKFLHTSNLLCDLLINSSEAADLLSSNKYDVALINGYELCPYALISPVVSYVATSTHFTQYSYAGLPDLPLYDNSAAAIVYVAKQKNVSVAFYSSYYSTSFFTRRILETFRTFKERYQYYLAANEINDKVKARFGDDFPDVREIAMNVSLDFSNSHQLLEEPRPISPRLRYIGGVGLPKPKPLSQDINKMLNKNTVIFSFGTQVGPDKISEDMKHVFINTFKRFPDFNFMWKYDGKTDFKAPNLLNMEWLPQTDLLYDSRVVAFISHMGLNSFTEASFAGVPVIAIPLFADQVHNALRAVALGTGVLVRKTEITEENLTRALQKILYDERYRNRAREVASMISALPDTPQRIFLEGIETASKCKNLSGHLLLRGAHHHFFVQIGWDVATCITLSICLAAYVLTYLTIYVLRKLPITRLGKTN